MTSRIEIPRDRGWDNSFALLSEGYKFISNRCRRYQSNIFQTRLMGQKIICISGKEATEVFYDTEKFQRKGAAPKRIQKTLLGENGVQTMDDEAHRHRKQLFMSLMTPERLQVLKDITNRQWEIAIEKWESMNKVVLFTEANEICARAACQWAGVPLQDVEVKQRTSDLGALIEAFGAIGPRHWHGRSARIRTDEWIREIIAQVRAGKLSPSEDTPIHAMAWHRDLDGSLMDLQMAAVELINILRPIVAIGRYITFGALALHDFPEVRGKLKMNEGNFNQMFVQEIRRFYPFGPFLGARVRQDFFWGGHDFKKGTLVLLDIYGTNHDPDLWEKPNQFWPDRFVDWQGSPFDFIPQGGGEYSMGHRCAGEWVTIEVMKTSLNFLTNQIDYKVPEQDLNFNTIRMPSIINSRFIISDVRKVI